MKKWIVILVLIGAGLFFFFSKEVKVIKDTALTFVVNTNYVNDNGLTVKDRVLLLENFRRKEYSSNSFSSYIQNYQLKEATAKIINYDGNDYIYQSGHVGVLDLPVPSNGLQQCADALIRLRAEYLWEQNRKDEIGFKFTSGHYCSWSKYVQGYRPKVNGSKVSFHQTAVANSSKESFYKYLDLIYMYAGTQSLYNELPKVKKIENVEVGDMLIYPGSPGHVIMVVDKASSDTGENMFIFAQGNTPAQSVHMLKNLNNASVSPWYKIEMGQYLEIPTYYFNEVKFMRFK
jgi:hypothetical protein